MVSVIIPSRQERFLNNTINDVLSNATGETEVFVILDAYDLPENEVIEDRRVVYIRLPADGDKMQKRIGINRAVSMARGKYVMSLDAHCMVGRGFDEILAKDCEENWIVVPRRYKLEPLTWTTHKEFAPVDYEYWLWQQYKIGILKPYRWDRPGREHIMIDDTLTMQGSCWFMHKSYFQKMGFMRVEGYTGWGQEDVELCMETWVNGGRVVVNKNTWYAHLFKGLKFGRMYRPNNRQHQRSREYAFNYWCIQRKDDFIKVIKKFMPLQRWVI